MRKSALGFLGLFVIFLADVSGQSSRDKAIEMFVTTQVSPLRITVKWKNNHPGIELYRLQRRVATENWPGSHIDIPGTSTEYIDSNVSIGVVYEYRMERSFANYFSIGAITATIQRPEVHFRGKLIMLIAGYLADSLSPELQRLKSDIESDGWEVISRVVPDTTKVPDVKNIIKSIYIQDSIQTKSLFIVGHIAVPYSGEFAVDGHNDHRGAWPADVYYADMNGVWTDISRNTTNGPARIHNLPGDGKFDQNTIFDAELELGRLDLSRMPAFSQSEIQLTRNYLNKNHAFRKKQFAVTKRAVVDDNFGYFSGEAFSSGAYRNFAAFLFPDSVRQGDYFNSMANDRSYLWSYGCGGGSFSHVSGVGNTTNFASANLGGVFTMLFGSYFGDWDVPNNVLRAPLCQGKTLTNAWSGRPYWILHWMGIGNTIGHSTRMTQNNDQGDIWVNWGHRLIHIALMGDPTLRNDIVDPVSNVVAQRNGFHVDLNWNPSPQSTVLGYHIYAKSSPSSPFSKINDTLVTSTNFKHLCLVDSGVHQYMVRALVLEETPSGTYYNMSEGMSDTVFIPSSYALQASANAVVYPNSSTVNFSALARNASSFLWEFGDGESSIEQNPVHTYLTIGEYDPRVIVSNDCETDTISLQVSITQITGIDKNNLQSKFKVFPNPTDGKFYIASNQNMLGARFEIFNSNGKRSMMKNLRDFKFDVDLSTYPKGIYNMQIITQDGRRFLKKLALE